MLVIHGLWAYGAAWLWAEDSALPVAAPPQPGWPSRAPRPHPFALDGAGLAGALAEMPGPAGGLAARAVDDELTLRLPSGAAGPLASPELIRPPGQDGAAAGGPPGRRRASLAAWRVPALAFEPAAAVDLLAGLGEPGAFGGQAVPGGTVRYLAAVARLAADLPARGRVLPALRDEDGGYAARWRPVLSGADAERARELAGAMPALCRATGADGASTALILTGALDALADAAARAWLAAQPLLPARRGRRPARVPVTERWIAALTTPGAQVELTTPEDEREAAELAAQLDAWHRAAQLPAGPVRTCFRLVEPDTPGDGAGRPAWRTAPSRPGTRIPGTWSRPSLRGTGGSSSRCSRPTTRA